MSDHEHGRRPAPDGILRAFMDHGPVVAFIKDDTARYLYVNSAMERLFGVNAADVLGKPDNGWLPRSLAESIQEHDTHVLAGRRMDTVEAVPRPDGTTDYWRLIRFPFSHPDGQPLIGGVAVNVSELHHAQTQLADSERRYRNLVESAQGLICTHDMEGRILTVNRAALATTGMTSDEVVGRNMREVLTDASREQFPLYLERIRHVGTDTGMMFVRAKSGRELAWQYRNVMVSEPGHAPYVLGHAQDVTELRDAQEQLRLLAMTDDLTGLHNRRGFFTNGGRQLGEAERSHKPAAVVYVDIDGLKKVNDTYGHDAGSALIARAADVLKNSFRAADVVGRIGGDEFVALALVSREDASRITDRLQWHLDKFNAGSRLPYKLEMSVGLSFFDPGSAATLDELVKQADAAMYHQKRPKLPFSGA